MKSGSIDANLQGSQSHAASSIHIAGSWRCKA